ncbi:MAG: HIT domain-containing protein, partial [Candidatus Amesbacteria bacterium]|nr:HIT domain-containing protein [Candidatus Amesbacteria bacterium]
MIKTVSKNLFSLAKSKLGPLLTQLGFATPLRNLLPVKKVYQDDQVMAFYHPKPFWETHIVIVPTHKITVLGE